MTDIKLQYSGQNPDIAIEGRRIVLVRGDEQIAQKLRTRLKFFLGEHFLDTTLGIPYYREVFKKNPNLNLLRSLFRQAILTTPQVVSVEELLLEINSATRTLEVSFKARIDTGAEIVISPFVIEL